MSFGTNIKRVRTEKGISQEELGRRISVHPNQLSKYERDQAAPSIDVVQRMAEALEVSIDTLVFGAEQKLDASISDRELISLFNRVQLLSDRQKDTVKDFLSAFVLKQDLKEKLTV
jgi:transcriptional regulator with XRE-family HTH domain